MGRKRKRNGSAVEQSRKFTCWPPTIVIFRSSIGNKYVEPTAINSYLSTRFSRFNNGRRLPHVAHSHSGYRSPAQNLERVEKPRWRIVSWLKLSRIIVRVTAIANILHSKICNFFFLFLLLLLLFFPFIVRPYCSFVYDYYHIPFRNEIIKMRRNRLFFFLSFLPSFEANVTVSFARSGIRKKKYFLIPPPRNYWHILTRIINYFYNIISRNLT